MDENAWNMGLFHKMNELTGKYEMEYPNDGSFFNTDDELADRAFRAALEFLVETGVYCTSTGRVLAFTQQEVDAAIREIPAEITVGEGRDARVIKQRRIEEREAINQCPGHHAPWTEELAPLVVKNFAQIPSGDYLEGFNFAEVDGREVYGMPIEVYAARREVAWLREGIRKAGRPGMAIAYYPINTRAPALLAPIDRDCGLRPTDGILLSVLPDVKVEQDYLAAAMVYQEYGSFKVNGGGGGTVGGFAGGLGGAIIESIAKSIVGFLVYRDTICNTGVGTVRATTGKTMSIDPRLIWAGSVVHQALHRNTNTICFGGGGGASGPGTETHLLEQAIGAISAPDERQPDPPGGGVDPRGGLGGDAHGARPWFCQRPGAEDRRKTGGPPEGGAAAGGAVLRPGPSQASSGVRKNLPQGERRWGWHGRRLRRWPGRGHNRKRRQVHRGVPGIQGHHM